MPQATDVWAALADADRRAIVDLLRTAPATTGEIESRLERQGRAGRTRFKALHHLKVLREAGLVTVEPRGRQRLNHLNAVALYEGTIGWLDPVSRRHATALHRLRTSLERPVSSIETISIRQETVIAAPREAVWDALTGDVGAWWGSPYVLTDHPTSIVVPAEVGAPVIERGDGAEALWGVVSRVEAGSVLAYTGGMGMTEPVHGVVTFALADEGDGTRLTLTHVAMGEMDPAAISAGYGYGWEDLARRLRAFVEKGERHGILGTNDEVASE